MARGWDSKAVEEQIEAAKSKIAVFPNSKQKSAQEVSRIRTRQTLELMRSQVQQQIGRTENVRYLEMLRKELTALEQQLSELS
jgi:hypothetical protein